MSRALEQLIDILDLEQLEVNLFRGRSPDERRQRIFGGQVAGQALVAAGRTVETRVVHSLHAYFLRPGDPKVPIVYQVDRIRDGKSFTTRRVVAIQHGEAIFILSASFQDAPETASRPFDDFDVNAVGTINLLEATRRFAFDTVLVALNAADVHRLSFIREVLPEAVRRGMGVIGMKVYSQGQLIGQGGITKADAMGYVLSLPAVSTIVIGCRTPAEVEENVRIARQFKPFADEHMQTLEERTRSDAERFTYYKMPRLP